MKGFLLAGFKINLNNLLTSHIIGYSLRQKVFIQVFDNVDKFTADLNHIDIFYGSLFMISICYYLKDLRYQKSFNNLENDIIFKPIIMTIEFLLLVLFLILTKNIENAI